MTYVPGAMSSMLIQLADALLDEDCLELSGFVAAPHYLLHENNNIILMTMMRKMIKATAFSKKKH